LRAGGDGSARAAGASGFDAVSTTMEHIKSGKLRALGVDRQAPECD